MKVHVRRRQIGRLTYENAKTVGCGYDAINLEEPVQVGLGS